MLSEGWSQINEGIIFPRGTLMIISWCYHEPAAWEGRWYITWKGFGAPHSGVVTLPQDRSHMSYPGASCCVGAFYMLGNHQCFSPHLGSLHLLTLRKKPSKDVRVHPKLTYTVAEKGKAAVPEMWAKKWGQDVVCSTGYPQWRILPLRTRRNNTRLGTHLPL